MRLLLIIVCFLSINLHAQRNLKDSSLSMVISSVNYKFNITSGDLNKLWGYNNEVGFNVDYKFKSNLTLGINGGFIFGNQLRDTSIFEGVLNEFGTVTAMSGAPGNVLFLMRGANASFNFGYVFNRLGNNPNSGLWVQLGGGFLMHKIRIESIYDDVPQLEGDYRQGYDRLHMGFATRQFVGYLYQADRRFLNFYAGFEFIQGFTENQRLYNFDLQGPDPGIKEDYLWGVKFGWLIPIYKRAAKEYYID